MSQQTDPTTAPFMEEPATPEPYGPTALVEAAKQARRDQIAARDEETRRTYHRKLAEASADFRRELRNTLNLDADAQAVHVRAYSDECRVTSTGERYPSSFLPFVEISAQGEEPFFIGRAQAVGRIALFAFRIESTLYFDDDGEELPFAEGAAEVDGRECYRLRARKLEGIEDLGAFLADDNLSSWTIPVDHFLKRPVPQLIDAPPGTPETR